MTISDKSTLQTQIATLFADNTNGDISADDLRTHLLDAVDSQVIQRQDIISTAEVNFTIPASSIDQNIYYVLKPVPAADQTLTLPAITAEMIGRSISFFMDYDDQQLTLVPDVTNSIIGRSVIPNRETFMVIRCLDATRWTVDSRALGSSGPEGVLGAESTAVQAPAGLDVALQVEFGPAQSNNITSIDVNGAILFHQVGVYQTKTTLNFHRSTSAGEAFFFARLLRNGVQLLNAIALEQTDDDITIPIFLDNIIPITVADLNIPYTVEIMRDGQGGAGTDNGSLAGLTSTNGWGSTPSARISISRF